MSDMIKDLLNTKQEMTTWDLILKLTIVGVWMGLVGAVLGYGASDYIFYVAEHNDPMIYIGNDGEKYVIRHYDEYMAPQDLLINTFDGGVHNISHYDMNQVDPLGVLMPSKWDYAKDRVWQVIF